MKNIVSGLLIFASLFLVAPLSAEPTTSAIDTVKQTAGTILEKIRLDRENLTDNPSAMFDLVSQVVLPRFDFLSMSRWVLGKSNWDSASETQRSNFIDQFSNLLVNTYGNALLEYSDQSIEYLEEKQGPKPNMKLVNTQIIQASSAPVPIDYLMHEKQGEWKVIDVIVDGISLIKTYRGEFSVHVRKKGMDDLIATLQQRNSVTLSN